jgi:hypothetical protein
MVGFEFNDAMHAIFEGADKARSGDTAALRVAISRYLDDVAKHNKLHIGFEQIRDRLVWKCKDWIKEPTSALVDDIYAIANQMRPVWEMKKP